MDAREPEQQTMMDMTTKAQRVGLVLISKSNFISRGNVAILRMRCRQELGEEELIAGGRECRNKWLLW
jgi:hypothetical protein